ncbi:HNH endonuclease [Gillisia mitskevichiae]|uniref:HNH endonuclease n=1 Tax=Gillisia mitskevichiae TaxID=270921 RepID=A0A495NX94_9FLAO|nr:HNH endonuclease [Gillisia mitskevichiae]RKS42487.1 HNH endonuclease [Gillisia mitskevichiae]
MTGEFNQQTKNILAKRAGEKCTLCKKNTSSAHSNYDEFVNLGEAAHIHGRKKGKNNRFDEKLTDKQIKDIRNGIWLCPRCHKDIDSDEIKYTATFLIEIREKHEIALASGAYNVVPSKVEKEIVRLEKLLLEKERSSDLTEKLFEKEILEYKKRLSTLHELLEKENRKFEQLIDEAYTVMKDSSFEKYTQITQLFYQRKFDEAEALLDEDKIIAEAEQLKVSLENKANLILVKARIAAAKGEIEECIRLFEKSLDLHLSYLNIVSFIRYLIEENLFDKARKELNKAFAFYNENEKQALLFTTSGNIYKYELKIDKAIIEYNKALKLYKNLNKKEHEQSAVLNNIGLAYNSKRQYSSAIISYINSIRKEEKENFLELAKIYVNMGSPFMYKKYYECAVAVFNHAINLCSKILNKNDASRMCLKIAHSGLAHCSYMNGETLRAIEHYKNSEKALDGFENIYSRKFLVQKSDLFHNMAAMNHEQGNVKEAMKYYNLNLIIENSFKHTSQKVKDRNLAISYFNYGMLILQEKIDDPKALFLIKKAKKLVIENDGFDLSPDTIEQMTNVPV